MKFQSQYYRIISIYDSSFENIQKIKTIDFLTDSKLKIISKDAFFFIYFLKKITIPGIASQIDERAFSLCIVVALPKAKQIKINMDDVSNISKLFSLFVLIHTKIDQMPLTQHQTIDLN